MQGKLFYISEKLDGSSFSFYKKENEFGVCSRNLELKETDKNTFWRIARELNLEEKMKKINNSIAIQGEIAGPGVNGNRLNLSKIQLFVFNVFDINTYKRLNFADMIEFCKDMELQTVPIINSSWKFQGTMEDIISMADGESMLCNRPREGIVFRLLEDSSISFKAISNSYLLNYKI
jgi:RNA ligase (TIGR02306 family)